MYFSIKRNRQIAYFCTTEALRADALHAIRKVPAALRVPAAKTDEAVFDYMPTSRIKLTNA